MGADSRRPSGSDSGNPKRASLLGMQPRAGPRTRRGWPPSRPGSMPCVRWRRRCRARPASTPVGRMQTGVGKRAKSPPRAYSHAHDARPVAGPQARPHRQRRARVGAGVDRTDAVGELAARGRRGRGQRGRAAAHADLAPRRHGACRRRRRRDPPSACRGLCRRTRPPPHREAPRPRRSRPPSPPCSRRAAETARSRARRRSAARARGSAAPRSRPAPSGSRACAPADGYRARRRGSRPARDERAPRRRADPQPPATAGRIVTSAPSATAVSSPSWNRMSSPET